jgi:hypothetical protein
VVTSGGVKGHDTAGLSTKRSGMVGAGAAGGDRRLMGARTDCSAATATVGLLRVVFFSHLVTSGTEHKSKACWVWILIDKFEIPARHDMQVCAHCCSRNTSAVETLKNR